MVQSLRFDRPGVQKAWQIWQAGVAAVKPHRCIDEVWSTHSLNLAIFERILVVGGGKAGAAMAAALEDSLHKQKIDLQRVHGWVNVPNETVCPTKRIHLHPSRPMGVNHPTKEAWSGTLAMLDLVERAGPNDLLVCLISGGGSALLCAPVPGISLEEKQLVTKLLHRCGASIQEMNAVRKHLSRIKGGGLARTWLQSAPSPRPLLSLIISDVIGDPLDVIASGPTAVDPTTFADALAILEQYQLMSQVPETVLHYLQAGQLGEQSDAYPETMKQMPVNAQGQPVIWNLIVANSEKAARAAKEHAEQLGYVVLNEGIQQGDTASYAQSVARQIRALKAQSFAKSLCILSTGETTVKLPHQHGLGGRNQEWVLALIAELGEHDMRHVTVLSGGTDGEDGPTDAAGAWADATLIHNAHSVKLDPLDYLHRHDSYHFFAAMDALLKTGLTDTNVMDLRVILIEPNQASSLGLSSN